MSMLNAVLTVAAVIGCALYLWSYTPKGKKWLKDL